MDKINSGYLNTNYRLHFSYPEFKIFILPRRLKTHCYVEYFKKSEMRMLPKIGTKRNWVNLSDIICIFYGFIIGIIVIVLSLEKNRHPLNSVSTLFYYSFSYSLFQNEYFSRYLTNRRIIHRRF
jgi:hypothetical protein